MNQNSITPKPSAICYNELPVIDLIESDISTLDPDQLRMFLRATREKLGAPQTRRAESKREARKLEGKPTNRGLKTDINELI